MGHNHSLVLDNIKISLDFAQEFLQTNYAFELFNILMLGDRAKLTENVKVTRKMRQKLWLYLNSKDSTNGEYERKIWPMILE